MADVRNEPSMEDILASIKRIIADDGPGAPATPPIDADDPEPEIAATPFGVAGFPAAFAPLPASSPVPPASMPSPVPPTPAEPAPANDAAGDTLMSDDAALASRQSLSSLALLARPAQTETTLDGLVREMLRPLLREWLDAKLPAIVETLVAREIARITGQAG